MRTSGMLAKTNGRDGSAWRVDIGGTFTDIRARSRTLAAHPQGATTAKRPGGGRARRRAARLADAGLHFSDIDVFIHARRSPPTRSSNGGGARTALIATDGFRDVLDIANGEPLRTSTT